jgi:hypothetical protein
MEELPQVMKEAVAVKPGQDHALAVGTPNHACEASINALSLRARGDVRDNNVVIAHRRIALHHQSGDPIATRAQAHSATTYGNCLFLSSVGTRSDRSTKRERSTRDLRRVLVIPENPRSAEVDRGHAVGLGRNRHPHDGLSMAVDRSDDRQWGERLEV